jgi:hypothetical protein
MNSLRERLASALGELVAASVAEDAARAASVFAAVGQRRIEMERRRSPPTPVKGRDPSPR